MYTQLCSGALNENPGSEGSCNAVGARYRH
jgi:hypothetical protein